MKKKNKKMMKKFHKLPKIITFKRECLLTFNKTKKVPQKKRKLSNNKLIKTNTI